MDLYDYTEDILHKRFTVIASLIRKGDISALNEEARNLLADFLEGKNKVGVKPDRYRYEFAETVYLEYESLKKYGRTISEQAVVEISAIDDSEREGKGMNREEAFAKLKEMMPELSHYASHSGIEELRRLGKKEYFRNMEEAHQEQFAPPKKHK